MNIANNMPSHVPAETTGKTQYGDDSNHILVNVKINQSPPRDIRCFARGQLIAFREGGCADGEEMKWKQLVRHGKGF